MNGTVYAITEIVGFLVGATVIGFLLGRVTKRGRTREPGTLAKLVTDTELAESRELIASLEHKLEVAMAAVEADADRGDAGTAAIGDLEARLAEAEVTIAELRATNEALEAMSDETSLADDPEIVERLTAELDRRLEQIERLEAILAESAPSGDAVDLASHGESDDVHDSDEDAEAKPAVGARPAVGWSTGSGGFADTLVEFD